jgi:hypothetical protein
MEMSGATRTASVTGGVAVAGGLAITIQGILRSNLAHTVGGGFLATTAAILIALAVGCQRITDTRDERRALAASQRQAVQERTTYFAAQAALENDEGRLKQAVAAARAKDKEQLRVERAAMEAEFAERRDVLRAETIDSLLKMIASGKLAHGPQGKLIPFPGQQISTERATARERSREHGAIGP